MSRKIDDIRPVDITLLLAPGRPGCPGLSPAEDKGIYKVDNLLTVHTIDLWFSKDALGNGKWV